MTARTFQWLVFQELRRLLLARWVGGATALLCACSAFSIVLGTRDLQEHTVAYQELLQERVAAQLRSERVMGRSAEPGLRVVRKPASGAILANGIEPEMPAAWEFTPAGAEALAPYVRSEVGINGRSVGDLPGIIAGLGGLLALWLGVSTLVSDRGAGRFAALRSLPVAPETMVIVRLAGGTLTLILVAALWSVTVALSVRIFVPADVVIPPWIPIWMAGPALCYLALMFALGTTAGAASREGLNAFATALLIWIAIVFVVPQSNQLIIRSVIQLLPQARMEVERREHMADASRLLELEIGAAMAAQWPGVRSPSDEQQSTAYFAVGEPIWSAGLARIRAAARLEEREWREQRAHADRVAAWLDGLNPSSWLVETMAELSGTGHSMAADWVQTIAAHDKFLDQQLFSNRPRVNARVNEIVMAFDRRPGPRFSDLPAFTAPADHAGTWTSAARRSFAGLAVYTMLAMAAAYFSLRSRLR